MVLMRSSLLGRLLRRSRSILALLTVLGLIFAPPVIAGYREEHLANAYLLQKNAPPEAYPHYKRALLLLPWRKDLLTVTASAAAASGDYLSAVEYYEQALDNHIPLNAPEWAVFGFAYMGLNRPQEALARWQEGLAHHPEALVLYETLAVHYRETDALALERETLEQYIALGGQNPYEYYRLGMILCLEKPERAVRLFTLAANANPDYKAAAATMRAALDLAARETDASKRLVIIGRGLGLVNEWRLAERAFRQAVAADGDNAEAWAWLGEAEQQLGREGGAELERALSLQPDNPVVHSLRALYWTRQGQPQQTPDEYRLAAKTDPSNPLWQVLLAESYARLGNLPPALEAYQRAVELAPNEAGYWRLLAVFCAQYGVQVEEVGLPAARQAASLAPQDAQALDALGWTLLLLEQPAEARYHLARALNLEPDLASAHLHYGMAALLQNDRTAAYQHLLRARALDSDGAVGEQAQALLSQYFP